jgi:aspartyl-tRNA(Asn)/glutamyl-tRNA(Gln) amidotransferase subunit C
MIDRKTVENVAHLARLKLTPQETESFAGQLDSILEHIDQLSSVDASGVEPTCFIVPEHDPLRGDDVRLSLPHDRLTSNSPSIKKGHFALPKVIG